MAPITFGYATDIGKVRQHQEDALYTFFVEANSQHPDFGLFIVCDGMGGSVGAKAAHLAMQELALKIQQTIYARLFLGKSVTGDEITHAMTEGVQAGNAAILQWGDTHPDAKGAGSCLTALVLLDRTTYVAHVGDSGCFEVTQTGMNRLTRVHDFINALLERGIITEDDL